MTPVAPEYVKSKFYDPENDVLKEGASEKDKIDYEDLHNGYDWMLFYKELEPDMEAPYKLWNGEIVDIAPFRGDGGPGSGNFGHEGRPGEVGGSAPADEPSSRERFSTKLQKIVDGVKIKNAPKDVYQAIESVEEKADGKKKWSQIKLKDGSTLQAHGFSSMKEVLKDVKRNADDDGKMGDMSVWIKYRNGTEASYKAGDDIMEMKTSDIAAAMVKQGNTQYGYEAEFELPKNEEPQPAKLPEEPKEKKPAEKADKPKEKKAEAKVETATANGSAELKKAPYLESKASTLDDAQRASYEEQFSALKKENTDLQKFMDGVNYKVPNYDPTPFKNADNRKKEIKAEAEQLVDKMPEGTLISKGTVVYEKVADGKWTVHSPNRTYDMSKGYVANELCGASDTEDYPPITFLASTDDAKMVRDIQIHDDDTYTDWAAALNGSERKDLVKRAKKDPQFKELVDAVVMYTEGAYTDQRKVAQDLVKNGLKDANAQTVGEMANGNLYEYRDLWKGQSLKTSDSSIAGGMAHMIEAVNHSAPYEGTLYRVAQDRRLIKKDATTCWEPPKPGDKIKMDAPTSFTSDYDVEQELTKNKMGDIIHYELESGANALNVAALSRYKQAELLCCGEFEVVSCETKTQTIPIYNEPTEAQKKRGVKENEWGDKYFERYIATVKIRQVDKCKIGNRTDEEVVYADCTGHFDAPMMTFDCIAEGILGDRSEASVGRAIERLTSELLGDNGEDAALLLQAIAAIGDKRADGGPGSGNHGHKGVPGQVGGSAPSDKSSSRITETMKSERKAVSIKRPTEEQIRKATSQFGLEAYFEIEEKHSEELDAAMESGDQTAYKAIKKKCQAEYDKMRESALKDLPSYMEEGYYVPAKNVDDETAEVFSRQGFDSESGSFNLRGVASANKSDDVESVYLGKDFVKISEDEAKARFAAQYLGRKDEGTFGGLSKDDERTISLYTYATAANSALRKGEHSEQADKLKSIIDRTVSPERTVYRGLSGGDFTKAVMSKEVGDTFDDKGFMSTSYDKDVAKKFAGDNGAILEIQVPKGYGKSIDVTSYSNKPDENEVLLNAGTSLRIVSKDGNHIVCEYDADTTHRDGGPGSGNHGHKGVPGQVGGSAPGNGSRQSVTAKNVIHSYTGPKDTKSVVEAQGFGGLPKIYGKKAFDEAVKKSKFIAQRTYAASSKEILDSYRNMLYNGDFYVDCSVGGSQYGQGMYCAADYNGELTEGIKEEMDHYIDIGMSRSKLHDNRQEISDKKAKEAEDTYRDAIEQGTKDFTDEEKLLFKCDKLYEGTSEEDAKAFSIMGGMTKEQRAAYRDKANAVLKDAQDKRNSIAWMSVEEYAEKNGLKIEAEPEYYVETFTLEPDAKIITYDQIRSIQADSGTPAAVAYKRDYFTPTLEKLKSEGMKDDELLSLSYHLGLISEGDEDFEEKWDALSAISKDRYIEIGKKIRPMLPSLREEWERKVDENRDIDLGAFAAMLGYDAINAKGHGASGSYTVVLNRTKTIFLDETMNEDSKDSYGSSTIFFQQGEDGVWYAIRGKEVIGWVKAFDAQQENRTDGGPGSGNFGHKGRPGEVGGSSADSTFDSSKCEVSFGFGDELPKKDVDRALSLCGANVIEPSKNDDVRVRKGPDGVTRVQIETPDAYSKVFLREDRKELYLDELFLKNKGTGKGTAIVTEMVRQAEKNGFETIKLIGGGTKGDSMNGYYSFARLGFDAELPDTTVKKAKDSGIVASRISDLMKTKEGRDFWKENGYAIEMTFRVHEGSESRKALESYTKSRSDGGPGSGNFGHKGRKGEVGGSAPDGNNAPGLGTAEAANKITKKQYNSKIFGIADDSDRDYDERRKEVEDILKSLPVGSKVQTPAHWNDNGMPDTLIWDGDRWATKKSWAAGGWSVASDELADYFLSEDQLERPMVTSVAMTEEAKQKDLEQLEKTYWRNQESVWKNGGALSETATIKLRKLELDRCGEGFDLVGTDGKTYTKFDGKWVDKETYQDADMRKLKSPSFTGDFFDVNFGMNGIPAKECQKMREHWEHFNPAMKSKYEEALRNGTFLPAFHDKCSHYDPKDGTVHFDMDSDANTIIHELSHKIDDGAVDKDSGYGYHIRTASALMDKALPNRDPICDFKAVADTLGFGVNENNWFEGWEDGEDNHEVVHAACDKYIEFWSENHHIPGFEAVADAISGQTLNQLRTTILGGGHDESYWNSPYGADRASKQSTEYWANFCMCRAFGYDEALGLLKKVTPNLYKAAEELWEEVFNGKHE